MERIKQIAQWGIWIAAALLALVYIPSMASWIAAGICVLLFPNERWQERIWEFLREHLKVVFVGALVVLCLINIPEERPLQDEELILVVSTTETSSEATKATEEKTIVTTEETTTQAVTEPGIEKATEPGTQATTESTVQTETELTSALSGGYVLNTSTKKFHLPDCASAAEMNEKNKEYSSAAREEIIEKGYEPCGRCDP